jgi:[ribosomal protein S18]-alanine N-acetyltransferase
VRPAAVQFGIERMRLEHIPAVSAIEQASFSQPWPARAYRKEIQQNRSAYYYVVRRLDAQAFEPAELGLDQATGEPDGSLVDRFTRLFRSSQEAAEPDSQDELCRVVGYAGLWLMADEAHVTTIAVHPKYRGEGIGELLLLHMIDTARAIPARWLTLEVRRSNEVAQALYRKYTFKEMGVRRRYYSDNGEDAVVMWTDPIDSKPFLEAVARNRATLQARLVGRA